jgi:hypothetical protein
MGYGFLFLHPALTQMMEMAVAELTQEFHISALRPQQHHITAPACFWPVLQGLELPPINHDGFQCLSWSW